MNFGPLGQTCIVFMGIPFLSGCSGTLHSSTYTVKNGSLLYYTNVSLLGLVSKIVSILLSSYTVVPLLTHIVVLL